MEHAQLLVPDADGVLTPHPLGLVEQSNDAYHGGPGISYSHLKLISGASPRHYWYKYLNPNREPEEQTPAKLLGSAIHSIILEPDLFTTQYVADPGINKRTNAGKEEWAQFVAENAGKGILTDDQMQTCLAVRDAVWSHPVAAGLLRQGSSEQSFYAIDSETGELIKCRTDHLDGDLIVDVKSTDDASPNGFGKSAANFGYPGQVAWYHDVFDAAFGEHPQHWVFMAVEKDPPYAIGLYFPDAADVARARMANRRDFMRIVEHKRADHWPDYAERALPLSLPMWWKP